MKKETYADTPPPQDPYAPEGLGPETPAADGLDPKTPAANEFVPPPAKEVVLPPDKHSEIIRAIADELKADGRPSAVNCLYHLSCVVEQLQFHESLPPLEPDPPARDAKTEPEAEPKT